MNVTINKEFLETQNKSQIRTLAEKSSLDLDIEDGATKDELIEKFLEASASKSKNKIWNPQRGIGKVVKDFMDEAGTETALTPEKVREIANSINDSWECESEEETQKKAKTHCAWYQSQYRKLNGTAKTRQPAAADTDENTDDEETVEEVAEVI